MYPLFVKAQPVTKYAAQSRIIALLKRTAKLFMRSRLLMSQRSRTGTGMDVSVKVNRRTSLVTSELCGLRLNCVGNGRSLGLECARIHLTCTYFRNETKSFH